MPKAHLPSGMKCLKSSLTSQESEESFSTNLAASSVADATAIATSRISALGDILILYPDWTHNIEGQSYHERYTIYIWIVQIYVNWACNECYIFKTIIIEYLGFNAY